MTDPKPWLTTEEACAHTGYSPDTLDRWIKEKLLEEGTHYGGAGRLRRWNREMLDIAVLYQNDRTAHDAAIAEKRRELFGRRKRA
jgi:hypothetical protein